MQSYKNIFIDVYSSEKHQSSTSEKKRKAVVKYIRKEKKSSCQVHLKTKEKQLSSTSEKKRKEKKRKEKKAKENKTKRKKQSSTSENKKSYILSVSIIKADLV